METKTMHPHAPSRPIAMTVAAVLLLIAILQLVRFIKGWELLINGMTVPIWASAIAALVAVALAVLLWFEARR